MIIYKGVQTPDTANLEYRQEQADWSQNNIAEKSYIKNKPQLSAVATSGSYNDLSNKPTIPTVPTVGNGTLTIKQGTTTLGTFSANATSSSTIEIPEGSSLSVVSLTQAEYDALQTKDPETLYLITDGITWTEVQDKPTFATVATSGSYNDLTNKPTIPSVGSGTLTITQGGTTKGTFSANATSNTTIEIDASSGGGMPAGFEEERFTFVGVNGDTYSKYFLTKTV